jgi:ABC-type multidrug transport system permease subunit
MFFKKIFTQKTVLLKLTFEALSIFFTIAVIYYASESFILKTNIENMSLFIFLIVGEIALVLPMSFAERLLAHFLEIRNQQFYQTLIGLKISPNRFVFSKAMVDTIFPLARVIFILVFSTAFLGFHFSLSSFIFFSMLQFFAIILFSLIALITSLIYLKFNRGIGLFYTLQSFAAIVGGVYFPVKIFPSYLKNISILLPQTQILQAARLIFQDQSVPLITYSTLIIWMALLCGVWLALNHYLVNWLKQKARFF